jgi:epoxide hydrolase A/B
MFTSIYAQIVAVISKGGQNGLWLWQRPEPMFPEPGFINTNGINMAVYQALPDQPSNAPPVIMCHGFPELAFSWRHQLPALARAGYHAIAPDQRGYGLSDAPQGIDHYSLQKLTGDLAGLMDALEIEKAVFCGHDWGSLVIWAMPYFHPGRIAGLISLNVPFKPRRQKDPITLMNERFGDDNYINFFQAPGVADNLFNEDIEKTLRFFMRRVRRQKNAETQKKAKTKSPLDVAGLALQKMFQLPEDAWPGEILLNDQELQYFADKFARHGFTGPLNWYRNFVDNWRDMKRFQPDGCPTPRLNWPVLMILAEMDFLLPPKLAEDLPDYCPDLTTYLVRGCGHWTQQEHPDEVNRAIIDWLDQRFATTRDV